MVNPLMGIFSLFLSVSSFLCLANACALKPQIGQRFQRAHKKETQFRLVEGAGISEGGWIACWEQDQEASRLGLSRLSRLPSLWLVLGGGVDKAEGIPSAPKEQGYV